MTAVELFSERGYGGVSLREIAGRANVPIALCGYYFGRKTELFMSLFAHSQDNIESRISAIESLAGDTAGPDPLERLVRLWVEPVLQLRGNPESAPFAILIARALWDGSTEAQAAIEKFYDPVAFAFLAALQKIMPDRGKVDLVWGYEWALGALLMHIADRRVERIANGIARSGDPERGEPLIRFICAGLRSLPIQSVERIGSRSKHR